MKKPRFAGEACGNVPASASSLARHQCPLNCIHFHQGLLVLDRTGYTHGTICGRCKQFISRHEWREAFLGRGQNAQ